MEIYVCKDHVPFLSTINSNLLIVKKILSRLAKEDKDELKEMYVVIEDITKLLTNVTAHIETVSITGDRVEDEFIFSAKKLAESARILVLEVKHAYSEARERKRDQLSFIGKLKRLFS